MKKEIIEFKNKNYSLEDYEGISIKIFHIIQMLKKALSLLENLEENLHINSSNFSKYSDNSFDFDKNLIYKYSELKNSENNQITLTDEYKQIKNTLLKYFLSPKPELYKGFSKEFEFIILNFQKELFIENQISLNILFNLSQIYYDFNDYKKSVISLNFTMPFLKNNCEFKIDFLRNMSFMFLINKKYLNLENDGFYKIISEIKDYSPSFSISLIYKYFSDYLKEINHNNPMILKYNTNYEEINRKIDYNKPQNFSYRNNMLVFPKD